MDFQWTKPVNEFRIDEVKLYVSWIKVRIEWKRFGEKNGLWKILQVFHLFDSYFFQFWYNKVLTWWRHDDVISSHPSNGADWSEQFYWSYLGRHCCALHHSNQIWNRPRHKLNLILMENWIILLFNIRIFYCATTKENSWPSKFFIGQFTFLEFWKIWFSFSYGGKVDESSKAHSRLKIQRLYPNFNGTILRRVSIFGSQLIIQSA